MTTNHSVIFIGNYPTLHDVANQRHYVGFESIYEHIRTVNVRRLFSTNCQNENLFFSHQQMNLLY